MLAGMDEPLPFDLALSTARLGRPLHFAREVDSTNRLLRALADGGAPEGAALLADFQSAGRGRRGRHWEAPPGSSLLLSVLLRPTVAPERLGQAPLLVGVAVAQTLERHLALAPALKWPNDLLVGGRKVGGILIEAASGAGGVALIVGIGINVNQSAAELGDLLGATSLAAEVGGEVARGELLAALLGALEEGYDRWQGGWSPLDEWRARATLLGEPIWVEPLLGTRFPATALDVAEDGALRVRREDGSELLLRAAEVSVRRG